MKSRSKGFHKIENDIEDVGDIPLWMWQRVRNGLMHIEALLEAHAELNKRFPEEKNEADD